MARKNNSRGKGGGTSVPALRNRNKETRRVRVADLEDAPWNFRLHPDTQRAALGGAIDELGFYGNPDVYQTATGELRLIDGHLRKSLLIEKYGPDAEIDVNVTDLDETEAKKATLTKDPLAAMAETDAEKLDELLRDIETGNEDLATLLTQLAEENGIVPSDGSPVSLVKLDTKPPVMSWVLIGIPTVRFGDIAADVERIALMPDVVCETAVNDG